MKFGRRIRDAAALLRRTFDAAGASGRWPTAAIMASQPSAALAARSVLARKGGYLVSNAPIAASIAEVWATSLVGDGPSVRSNHPDAAMRRALEAAWGRFFRRADIEGGNLVELLNRISRGLVVEGEAFVRSLTTERGLLRCQLLPAPQIDASVNREFSGGTIVAGIERGPNGEVLAFWVLPSSPDAVASFTMIGPPVRVDAADICHVFEPRFPGQIRGLSWLHPVATSILELDATQDAAITKAKVTALMCGFIRGTDSADLASGELSMEPGTLRKLPPDADITFSPTSDMSEINGFLTHMARSISAGVGAPYELVTGDLSNTNYSSARLGLQSFVRRVKAVRSSVLVSRFLQPAWERCITLEVLSGRLSAPDFLQDPEPFFDAEFLFPEFASINPFDETRADVEALNAGLRSRAEIIAARGRDFETVNAEIEADNFRPQIAPPREVPTNA